MMFKCEKCNVIFKKKWLLKRHIFTVHFRLPKNKWSGCKKQLCTDCRVVFPSMNAFMKHKREQHMKRSSNLRKCPICHESLPSQKIDYHLTTQHFFLPDLQTHSFHTRTVFEEFMKKIVKEQHSSFIKIRTVKNRTYFQCHRSGKPRMLPDDQRVRVKHGSSIKTGYYCPAKIILREIEGQKFEATIQKNHFGHELGINYLRLTPEDRSILKDKLEMGVPFERTIEDARNNHNERISLINKQDLKNIARDFILKKKMSTSKLQTITELWKGRVNTKGFGRCFQNVIITSADPKKITAEFTVTEEMSNSRGSLHGGATATIADMVSSVGLLCIDGNSKTGVSVNLSVNYVRGASIGEEIVLESKNVKVGKTLAYLDIVLKKKNTDEVVATCSHVKHIG